MPTNADSFWERLSFERRPIVIYGMGNGADKLIAQLEARGISYADIFASDDFVRGQSFHGHRVLTFSEVKEKYPEFVILLAFGTSRPDVLQTLYAMAESYPLYMPDLPIVGHSLWDNQFEAEHQDEISMARELFSDDASRALYDAVLFYRHTGDISHLKNAPFASAPFAFLPYESFVSVIDAGAYRGETVSELLSFAKNVRYALAIEPDARNYLHLKTYAENETRLQIVTLHAALFDKVDVASFYGSGNRGAALTNTPHKARVEEIPTLSVDSTVFGVSGEKQSEFPSELTDNMKHFREITQGRVDYIKYDVEGAEAEALRGSAELIKKARPILAISVYHRPEDLFSLPLLLNTLTENYTFYLTRTESLPAWELMLYAIPNERCII